MEMSAAALASPYSETAWKKLYPMSGHSSSSSVQIARPLMISRSSFMNNGRRGALRAQRVSGESKKDILQVSIGNSGSCAEIIQRSHTTNMAIGKEKEAVADPLSVQQLMDCNSECPALSDLFAQHADNLPGLPKIETVERFVHEKQWVRRK